MPDIRNLSSLWCDDITFCQEECDWMDCPRNEKNIRDKTIPHSCSVGIPEDCPKKQKGRSMGMSSKTRKTKVEFIESYWTGGKLGADYQWNDNHGELIRCKNCEYGELANEIYFCGYPHGFGMSHDPDFYCGYGKRKE